MEGWWMGERPVRVTAHTPPSVAWVVLDAKVRERQRDRERDRETERLMRALEGTSWNERGERGSAAVAFAAPLPRSARAKRASRRPIRRGSLRLGVRVCGLADLCVRVCPPRLHGPRATSHPSHARSGLRTSALSSHPSALPARLFLPSPRAMPQPSHAPQGP
eukprot:1829443-Rhodomonas_salina.1